MSVTSVDAAADAKCRKSPAKIPKPPRRHECLIKETLSRMHISAKLDHIARTSSILGSASAGNAESLTCTASGHDAGSVACVLAVSPRYVPIPAHPSQVPHLAISH